jgi:hypothetical protein
MLRKRLPVVLLVALSASSCDHARERPAALPRHAASARPVAGAAVGPLAPSAVPPSRTTEVLRKHYVGVGELAGTMEESPTPGYPSSRLVDYRFTLARGNAAPTEVASLYTSDQSPFGSGTPHFALRDAELTPDPVLVGVFSDTFDPATGRCGYHGNIWPLPESELNVPGGAYQDVFYTPSHPEPLRRVTITGSIKQNNLTVSLLGPKDTLRFRFVLFRNDQVGWYHVPDIRPPANALFIAPDLNEANQKEGK